MEQRDQERNREYDGRGEFVRGGPADPEEAREALEASRNSADDQSPAGPPDATELEEQLREDSGMTEERRGATLSGGGPPVGMRPQEGYAHRKTAAELRSEGAERNTEAARETGDPDVAELAEAAENEQHEIEAGEKFRHSPPLETLAHNEGVQTEGNRNRDDSEEDTLDEE